MTPVEIKLYQTASEPTMVEKTLVEKATVTGYFKQVQDITAPVIDLAFNDRDTFNLYFNSNYAYIALFNRYYFISRKEVGMNNILSIYMDEDVLMSFKNEIYNLVPLVTRQAQQFDHDIIDTSIPATAYPYIDYFTCKFLIWCKFSDNEIIPYDPLTEMSAFNDPANRFFSEEYDTNDIYSNGCIAMQVFSNVTEDGTKDNHRNGLVPTNRVYYVPPAYFRTMLKDITAPDFWSSLGSWFTDFSQNIYSLTYLPIQISKDTMRTYENQNKIQFMAKEYPTSNEAVSTALMASPTDHLVAGTTIHIHFSSDFRFLLSTTTIMLPFIGEVELDNQLIYKYKTNISSFVGYLYLIINPNTCEGQYIISTKYLKYKYDYGNVNYKYIDKIDKRYVIYTSQYFKVGSDVFLGSTDKNSKNQGIAMFGITTALSLLSGGIAGGAIGALGGSMSAATKKAFKSTQDRRLKVGSAKYNQRMNTYRESYGKDLASSGIDFASSALSEILPLLSVNGQVDSSSTTAMNCYDYGEIYVRVVEPNLQIPDNYYELYGGLCNLTVPLSTLKTKGYTKCANVHMTGFTNATSEEIAEIEGLLLSGVIL